MPIRNITHTDNLVAVLLSGGAGRRLGGADKGLENYKNKPLIEHVLSALKPQVSSFILCANRNQQLYREYGFPVVSDDWQAADSEKGDKCASAHLNVLHQGPMAGITAAARYLLSHERYQNISHILLSSCDSPNLPESYATELLAKLKNSQKKIAVVHDGTRTQNLHALIEVSQLESLCQYYEKGGRAMHRWYKEVGVCEVDFSHQADAFLNINSREQLGEQHS